MRDKLKEIQYELPKGRDDKHEAEKHVSACPSAEFSAPENKMPFNMPRICRWSELLSRCSRLSLCYRVMHMRSVRLQLFCLTFLLRLQAESWGDHKLKSFDPRWDRISGVCPKEDLSPYIGHRLDY